MHEFSLLANLFKKIEAIRAAENASKVVKVSVKIGALAHISGDHFREHFEHASQNTSFADAELEIEVSQDENAPDAQDIVLKSIEVEEEE